MFLAIGGVGACGGPVEEPPSLVTITGLSTTSATTTSGSDESADETAGKLDVEQGGTGNGGDTSPPNTCAEVINTESNQGCEFWAVDLPNAWAGINGSPAPADQQFAVVVANTSSDVPANVEVFVASSGTAVDSASVPIGQIHEFRLAALNQAPRANTYDGQAYRVVSDVPITAYQFNPLDNTVQVFSNDASLLFPTHVLDTDYTAVTGDSILLGTDQEPQGDNSGAFVSVVGTEDGTVVDLFPAWGLYPGASQGVMLDRGQVFTAVSLGPNTFPGQTGDGNLSGSRVVADRPVAVFSGNVATIEPNPGQCCADHLEQQMLPLVAWGHGYAAAPPPAPGGGTYDPAGYRISGSFDGTQLTYSPSTPPGAPTTIDAGQTVRFQTNQAFTVTSNAEDRPFAITQFLLSNQAISGFGQPGDPAMISLPAVEQFQTSYIFLVPDGYATNYVTVVRVADTEVSRDGVSVAAAAWRPLGTLDGVAHEYVALGVPTCSHSIESEEPCGIISVRYDPDVSYGYPGGSGLKIISEPPPPPQG
ncbi:MAG: IgGFc-binding protein [Myxococcales bacterium]|nr:IgGFc-binding protein [Myxococcales bacterium]